MIAVTDPAGKALIYINVRVARKGESSDHAVDDRFTDLVGHTAWPGGYVGGDRWTSATLFVNERNVQAAFKSATIDVSNWQAVNESIDLTIALEAIAAVCPPGHDKAAWHAYFTATTQRFAQPICTATALALMNPDMQKCGAQFQYTGGNPPTLRPRLFLPNPGGDPFAFAVDLGDFGGPWQWIPRGF